MPRESIGNGEFTVRIGWSRDGYVQIGVEMNHSDVTGFTPGEGTPRNLHELVHMWERASPDVRIEEFGTTGLWSDLDRVQVNALIRVLRRARDQAFGRDE